MTLESRERFDKHLRDRGVIGWDPVEKAFTLRPGFHVEELNV